MGPVVARNEATLARARHAHAVKVAVCRERNARRLAAARAAYDGAVGGPVARFNDAVAQLAARNDALADELRRVRAFQGVVARAHARALDRLREFVMGPDGDGKFRPRQIDRAQVPMDILGAALLAAYGRALLATSRAVPGPRDGPVPRNWGAMREHAVRAVAAAGSPRAEAYEAVLHDGSSGEEGAGEGEDSVEDVSSEDDASPTAGGVPPGWSWDGGEGARPASAGAEKKPKQQRREAPAKGSTRTGGGYLWEDKGIGLHKVGDSGPTFMRLPFYPQSGEAREQGRRARKKAARQKQRAETRRVQRVATAPTAKRPKQPRPQSARLPPQQQRRRPKKPKRQTSKAQHQQQPQATFEVDFSHIDLDAGSSSDSECVRLRRRKKKKKKRQKVRRSVEAGVATADILSFEFGPQM